MKQIKKSYEKVKLKDLKCWEKNPKKHNEKLIEKSINNFGYIDCIIIDEDNRILAGHGRYKALKKQDIKEIDVIRISGLTEEEKEKYSILNNSSNINKWDWEILINNYSINYLKDLGFNNKNILNYYNIYNIKDDIIKSNKKIKILNLYSGIGGNRKLWGNNFKITAVEWDKDIAKIYSDYFPDDTVIIDDAHKYLEKNWREYEFIWSSPPCITHTRLMQFKKNKKPKYPDMSLYQEIIFLKYLIKDKIFCIENVKPYYPYLINPDYEIDRHIYWTNININKQKIQNNIIKDIEIFGNKYGFNLDKYNLPKSKKQQILNNLVNPVIAKIILESALKML